LLAGNRFGVAGIETLRQVFLLGEVAEVDLSDNELEDEGFSTLLRYWWSGGRWLANLPRVRRLLVAGNGITSTGAIDLAETAEKMPRLTELDLAHNALGTPGVEALATSPHLRGLRRLNLSRNHLGPAGVEVLAASGHLTGLTRLDLSGNGIGPRGVEALL